jgi:pimeloyl-ACP methyl ester carboxylesterase/DNA-binding winged helix-turn-helix (wHTH) protein
MPTRERLALPGLRTTPEQLRAIAMHSSDESNKIALPGFVFDLEHQELREASGAQVMLRAQLLAVMNCLARKADRVVTKDELMQAVWPGVVVTEDSLVQCIKDLRKVLKDEAHSIIQTLPKRGYRLVPSRNAPQCAVSEPLPPAFHQDIRFATTADGVRIAYAVSGQGPVLVRAAHWMTHLEWDWQSAVYGPWIKGFSQRYMHVRYDARGCGLSDRCTPPTCLDDDVRDLEAVVDAAGLNRFALLGRSQGGAISARYAARHPERVSHMIMLGGFVRGARKRGALSDSQKNSQAFWQLIKDGWGQDNAAFRQLMTSRMFPGANPEQMQAFNQLQRVACTPQGAAHVGSVNGEYDASGDLCKVRCPALVLHSPDDAAVPFEEGRMIASMIEGARLMSFTSVNHTPLPTEPAFDMVNRLIDEFLLRPAGAHDSSVRDAATRPALRVVPGPVSMRSSPGRR